MTGKGKGKRKAYSIKEIRNLQDFRRRNPQMSLSQMAIEMKLPKSTLSKHLKRDLSLVGCNEKAKKQRRSPLETLELELSAWIIQKRHANVNLPISCILYQAGIISKRLGMSGFSFSKGWFQKFTQRYKLSSTVVCGESGDVDPEDLSEGVRVTNEAMKGYAEENIFNADETGLYYQMQPSRTFSNATRTRGGKQSKKRVTVLLAVSKAGEKLRPLVIGKFKKPRCFKNVDMDALPVKYVSTKTAWMNRDIFSAWLRSLNSKMCQEGRKILLLLDNFVGHVVDLELSNVRIFFFPPRLTSKLQPCDGGIISSFKAHYKRLFVFHLVEQQEFDPSFSPGSVNLAVASRLVGRAWALVSEETIRNCWKHTSLTQDASKCVELVLEGLRSFDKRFNERDAREFLLVDSDLQVGSVDSADEVSEGDEGDSGNDVLISHKELSSLVESVRLIRYHLRNMPEEEASSLSMSLAPVERFLRKKRSSSEAQAQLDSFFKPVTPRVIEHVEEGQEGEPMHLSSTPVLQVNKDQVIGRVTNLPESVVNLAGKVFYFTGDVTSLGSFKGTAILTKSSPLDVTTTTIEGDGNCLYRSFSMALFGTQEWHSQIHAGICSFILSASPSYISRLGIKRKDPAVRCREIVEEQRMEEDGVWGGSIEILAFACLLDVNVAVLSPVGSHDGRSYAWTIYMSSSYDIDRPTIAIKHVPYLSKVGPCNHFETIVSFE